MKKAWVGTGLAASLLLLAGGAVAQGQQQGQQRQQGQKQQQGKQQGQHGQQGMQQGKQPGQQAYEATKHFAVVYAGLRDAQLNSDMLSQISSDARSYDRDHGQLFVRNIQQSLSEAQTHLAHLRPMATTDTQKKQWDQLNQTFTKASSMVQPMTNELDNSKAIHSSSQRLARELNNGMAPLRQMASEMNAKIKVG